MKYGLIFFETPEELARREGESAPAYWGAWSAYIDLLADSGVMVRGAGAGLQSPDTATTVRIQGSKQQIQDGPLADTKEQIGGLVVIDAATLDEAISWAAKAPCASAGGVEIRPIMAAPEG